MTERPDETAGDGRWNRFFAGELPASDDFINERDDPPPQEREPL